MSRAIEVRVLGDATSLQRAVDKSSTLLARFGGDAEKAARAQVMAGTQSREALQQLQVAYQELADSAAKGSDEQIVAAQKAADAQRALAATTVSASEESTAAMSKATAGAAGFVKQMAFFGAGFLGFQGLKDSIQVVLQSQTSLQKLDRAIINAHASVNKLTPVLAKYADTSRRLGFTDEQTREAETELITAFGATHKALNELAQAQDLARAKNEDLGTAAQQLILLQEGNTRAAKQFGLALPDLTKAQWEQKAAQDGLTLSQEKGKLLYDELLPRIKDQAQAFANSPSGKIAEFHAEVTKLEEGIGTGLLPVVTRYLTEADAWLAKAPNQRRVTHDLQTVVSDLAGALGDAYKAVHAIVEISDPVVHALGGWKTVLEAIVALKLASVLRGWGGDLTRLIGSESANTGVQGAAGTSGRLLGNLKSLAKIGGLTIGVDMILKAQGDKGAKGLLESLFGAGLVGFAVGDPEGALAAAGIDLFVHMIASDGKTPFYGAGPGSSKFQLGGKTYYWGTQPADQALRAAGYTGSLKVGDEQKWLERHPGLAGSAGYRAAKGAASHGGAGKIVDEAKLYGVGSGGTYATGGGHGGMVRPGSKLDCSGYVYQVFSHAGFKGFPGTSEDQWKISTGPNWTAEFVNAGDAQPGDVVFMVGSPEYPSPGHVGIVTAGHGRSAEVMQYYETGKPPDTIKLNQIGDLVGIKRFYLVKKGAGAGGSGSHGSSPFGPSTPSAGNSTDTSAAKATATVTGSNLLPQHLRDMITHASDKALTSSGLIAASWLTREMKDFEHAKAILEDKLRVAHGNAKETAAIQAELRSVDTAIARAQHEVAAKLASWATTELGMLEKQADAAFDKATQAHIANVLDPRYFQGNDPTTGLARQTPAEKALAKMQQQDTWWGITDSVKQAKAQLAADEKAAGKTKRKRDKYNATVLIDGKPVGEPEDPTIAADKKALAAAERAVREYKLEQKASKERAAADAAYAKAVKQYEAARSKEEKKMNHELEKLLKHLAKTGKGFKDLGEALDKLLKQFGLHKGAVHTGKGKHGHHTHHHGHHPKPKPKHHHPHHPKKKPKHHPHHAAAAALSAAQAAAVDGGASVIHVRPEEYRRIAEKVKPHSDGLVVLKMSGRSVTT